MAIPSECDHPMTPALSIAASPSPDTRQEIGIGVLSRPQTIHLALAALYRLAGKRTFGSPDAGLLGA